MNKSSPAPRYPLLRIISFAVAALAVLAALTGIVAQAALLAWAVAGMALATFAASYYLKNN